MNFNICGNPIVDIAYDKVNSLINSKLPPAEKKTLRAVSTKKLLWPQNSDINIKFMEKVPIDILINTSKSFAKKEKINDVDWYVGPKNYKYKAKMLPYTTPEGYFIDNNDNILVFDPLQKELDKIENTRKKMNSAQFDKAVKDFIKKVIQERYAKFINLTLNFLDDDDPTPSQVRIGFNPDKGSNSDVGVYCESIPQNEETMNLGWVDVRNILHEVGHMLGLRHEHQAPSAGDFKNKIIWNIPKVYKFYKDKKGWNKEEIYNNVINRFNISETNDLSVFKNGVTDKTLLEYDPDSIMLYFYPGYLTYDPIAYYSNPQQLIPGPGTRQNFRLSKKDVKYLSAIYPPKTEPPITAEQFIHQNPSLVNVKKSKSSRSFNTPELRFDYTPYENNWYTPYIIGASISLVVCLIILLIIFK